MNNNEYIDAFPFSQSEENVQGFDGTGEPPGPLSRSSPPGTPSRSLTGTPSSSPTGTPSRSPVGTPSSSPTPDANPMLNDEPISVDHEEEVSSDDSVASDTTTSTTTPTTSQEYVLPETSLEADSQITVAGEHEEEMNPVESVDDDLQQQKAHIHQSEETTTAGADLGVEHDDDGLPKERMNLEDESVHVGEDSRTEEKEHDTSEVEGEGSVRGDEEVDQPVITSDTVNVDKEKDAEENESSDDDDDGVEDPLPTTSKPKGRKRAAASAESDDDAPETKKAKDSEAAKLLQKQAENTIKISLESFSAASKGIREIDGVVQIPFETLFKKKVYGQFMRELDMTKVATLSLLLKETKNLSPYIAEIWTICIPESLLPSDNSQLSSVIAKAKEIALVEGNHRWRTLLGSADEEKALFAQHKVNMRVLAMSKENWSIVTKFGFPLSSTSDGSEFFFELGTEARSLVRGLEPLHTAQQSSATLSGFKNSERFKHLHDKVRAHLGTRERRKELSLHRDPSNVQFDAMKTHGFFPCKNDIPMGRLAFAAKAVQPAIMKMVDLSVFLNQKGFPYMDLVFLSYFFPQDLVDLVYKHLEGQTEESAGNGVKLSRSLGKAVKDMRVQKKRFEMKPEAQVKENVKAAKRMEKNRSTTTQRRVPVKSLGTVKLTENPAIDHAVIYRLPLELLEKEPDTVKRFWNAARGILVELPFSLGDLTPYIDSMKLIAAPLTYTYSGRIANKDSHLTIIASSRDADLHKVAPRNVDVIDVEK